MKIGIVRRGYSGTGGAEAYALRFARAARAAGHEVILFGSAEWLDAPWDGEKVILAGGNPGAFADALKKARPRSYCDFLFSLERVWECDAYRAGDGVHRSWLERRAKYEPRWKSLLRAMAPKHMEILAMERALFSGGARCVIANSNMVKQEIVAHFGMSAEEIHVVYNGVPQWRECVGLREQRRAALGLDKKDFVLLFAGSGWKRKGLAFAMNALNGLPGAKLLVAGKGNLSRMPASSRTLLLGALSREEMPGAFAAADVFILPTIYDPFSNACLEALSAGLPVVTTRANGFAEIIEPDMEGSVVEEPSDGVLLRDVLLAWADPAKRVGARERLISKGAKFSIESNVMKTLKIIESLKEKKEAS